MIGTASPASRTRSNPDVTFRPDVNCGCCSRANSTAGTAERFSFARRVNENMPGEKDFRPDTISTYFRALSRPI